LTGIFKNYSFLIAMDYREHPLGRLLSLDILRRFQCPAWAEYLSAKIGVR
jgi:phosphoribosyl-dephospho-CoA transferase